ncbi:hypothetical protein CBR_g3385 [Chara braunii]|uniref:DUF659 domain-containing protein n=1 Tax=Chara braunii TaxID=69332 RepID=A0A388JR10_CHABU|nr:hypothetical protein CBR_g3385 [Chara braunii]|eukprot:GBG60142.1 hypothetical protein CBR_g3385 [Chara braunii]
MPSYHMVRTTLLDELDSEVQNCVRPLLDTTREHGCTIMTDGWTNIQGQTLCNYLVGTNLGAAYVATDVMHGKKDAIALATAWLKRVKSMDLKLSDITTFVTGSAGVNVAAMEVFEKDKSVKHMFWIPCVAHVMNLILEDIGGIDWVATRIAQARLVTRFFKRHGHAREVLEKLSKKTLLLPAETGFGTNVIMMTRLVDLREELTELVGADCWRETVWSTGKIRKDAAEITACIGSPPWWEDLRALCRMLEPIMDMLRTGGGGDGGGDGRGGADDRGRGGRGGDEGGHGGRGGDGRGRGGRGVDGVGEDTRHGGGGDDEGGEDRDHGGGGGDEGGDNRGHGGCGDNEEGEERDHRGGGGDEGGDDRGHRGGGDDEGGEERDHGGGGGDEGGHGRGGLVRGRGFVLKRLRYRGKQDNNISSRVRRRRLQTVHDVTVTEAIVVQQEQVVVSEDSMNKKADLDIIPSAVTAPEESGAGPVGLTRPKSPARVADTQVAQDSQRHLTQTTVEVHVEGRGGVADDGRTIPCGGGNVPPPSTVICTGAHKAPSASVPSTGEVARPPTGDVGLENGEVARTPTCAHEGEDARPATVEHVGLACPIGSLPPTAEMLVMKLALDGLPDISTLISPTLAFAAPPATGPADDTDGVSRGFDEFVGDTILHPTVSTTLAVFHVGAPHAVDQGLAEQVARNRRGGPHVAAQRSLGDSFERVDAEYVAQDGHSARDFGGEGSSVLAGPRPDPHPGPLRPAQETVCEVVGLGGGEDTRQDLARTHGGVPGGRDHEHIVTSDAQHSVDRAISRVVGGKHTGDARPHHMAMRSTPPHPDGVDPVSVRIPLQGYPPWFLQVTEDKVCSKSEYPVRSCSRVWFVLTEWLTGSKVRVGEQF